MNKMKKNYIIPTAKSIRLDAETLIALSGGDTSETPMGGGSSMSNERTPSHSIWGDED